MNNLVTLFHRGIALYHTTVLSMNSNLYLWTPSPTNFLGPNVLMTIVQKATFSLKNALLHSLRET